jgi:perosamine synthetase
MSSQSAKNEESPTSEDQYVLPWSGRGLKYVEEDISAVTEAMRNADPLTQGQYLARFEQVFSEYHGGLPSFITSSGAAAIELAALLLDIQPGDEVIIPAHTYVASAIPFVRRGATLVWADIDPDTRVITEETVRAKWSRRTKAVVVVHLYGLNAPMDRIMKLAQTHGFQVLEDCAQSLGATYLGQRSGTQGDMAIYSFHGQKSISTLGEGGALVVRDPVLAKMVPGLRHNGHHDFPADREDYWLPAMVNVDFDIMGVWPYNFSIGEPQCALGIQLMARLDDLNSRRHRYARRVIEALEDCHELQFQEIPDGSTHVYHLLSARYDGGAGGNTRDDLIRKLASEYRIQCAIQYRPLYRYPMFIKAGMGEADCPNTDDFFDNMLSFPLYEWLTDQQLEYLTDSVREAVFSLR